jgi:exodeoxyribonuclease VII large subunit
LNKLYLKSLNLTSYFEMMNSVLKLSELNGMVRRVVTDSFPDKLWVIGEISEMKVNRNGHCYLNLIEKEEASDTVVAQAKAAIWSYTFRMLRPYFETATGQVLVEGLKVLVSVSVEFHELYGYSLNIQDIDPTYTIGDMARRRREIIARLTDEGVVDMNKEVEFPYVPQKIAVISSETAAGYQDFTNQLMSNQAGYVFYPRLFPAVMQGSQAEASIIDALDQIYRYEDFFDVVVIIRGGGSQLDLSCFDNYNLAYHITQFPLPVITGIGHEKDNTIVDMVAHTRLKTPTAVAEFLIGEVARYELNLNEAEEKLISSVREQLAKANQMVDRLARIYGPLIRAKMNRNSQILNQTAWQLNHLIKSSITDHKYVIDRKKESLHRSTRHLVAIQSYELKEMAGLISSGLRIIIPVKMNQLKSRISSTRLFIRERLAKESFNLELASQKAYFTDPRHVLARGYSITTHNGIVLKESSKVEIDDIIETMLLKGTLLSKVTVNNETNNQSGEVKLKKHL